MSESGPSAHIYEVPASGGVTVLKALASEMRVRLLDLLAERDRNISELSQMLGISQPTVTKHIGILVEAGLVRTRYSPGKQGRQNRCRLVYDRFVFNLAPPPLSTLHVDEIEMPVGLFTHVHPVVTCGLADRDSMIGAADHPQAFFLPRRASAQLLWSGGGYVEYTFPHKIPVSSEIRRIELSMEICSETSDFNLEYPSDITVWINSVDVGTWTCPGDMGGKPGRLNPVWWPEMASQFGFLKTWMVDDSGSYVDGDLVARRTVRELGLVPQQSIRVRIGIKPEAINSGGFNLFGRCFGNYEQDVVLKLHYSGAKAVDATHDDDTGRIVAAVQGR